ncbi:MAG: 23S rRNA (guanosine(2251)-2'-O)-methyltransferase RlmB [Pseudomonadota bacterium]|nr:23S rRNA (guanosine(2251)-2'-O)-methyltransferase RlmB [Pseudomonadota bacterium]
MSGRKGTSKDKHGARDRTNHARRPQQRSEEDVRTTQDQAQWIYGIHAVAAALANPTRQCYRLVATQDGANALADTEPEPHFKISIEIVKKAAIASIYPTDVVHQGVALLATPLPTESLSDIITRATGEKHALVIALDQVTDPQNMGAIIRSAAAFGVLAVLVPDRHSPKISGAMLKAASGGLETVPLVRPTNLVRALEVLKSSGFWVVGLDKSAPINLSKSNLSSKCVLTLGSEGKGLRRLTRETCDIMVQVPLSHSVESLNVSATAAIALYEWTNQNISDHQQSK